MGMVSTSPVVDRVADQGCLPGPAGKTGGVGRESDGGAFTEGEAIVDEKALQPGELTASDGQLLAEPDNRLRAQWLIDSRS